MSDELRRENHDEGELSGLEIAIVGMAGKFPHADNIDEFWRMLKNGDEAITYFSDEELKENGIDPSLINDPNYVKSRCILRDEDKFDAFFFDFSPYEAELMDPQQRLFLETAWTALEDAGYNADSYDGLIGLFGGVSMNTYLYSYLASRKGFISSAEGYQLAIGNDKDFLTTRTSYKLNLKGPSVDVQTACSTSLVAVHIACQNLLNYSCDMAMAGGVSITVPQKQGYYYQEGMILSPDGHCRAFDEKAAGTISGNGMGIVVLKRLDDALADKDHIYAVIKGSAFNNDGSNRVGYTAPSVEGQAEVIASALAVADINPETISYVEAHGTGTVLGDPIEISALTQVYREHTEKKQFCALGSVKTNIGHLDAAAGVAGLIKTALCLKHKQIPASLNFEKPNPKIDFDNSPFFVNRELRDWKNGSSPRRAAVSSFGIGGTNAHVLLEEPPDIEHTTSRYPSHLFCLSAKTPTALDQATKNLGTFIANNPGVDPGDVAGTLQRGRKTLNLRRFIIADTLSEASDLLTSGDPKYIFESQHQKQPSPPGVTFMFSGQGAQYVNMGRQLYDHLEVFSNHVDECCRILKQVTGQDLRDIMYPASDIDEPERLLKRTEFTQPALFVIEYAMAKYWIHLGINPQAMVGHSIGEYVAAHLAGVFSLEDALNIVATRGRLMQSMPEGSMLSLPLEEAHIKKYLSDEVSVAAINSAKMTVVSGPTEAVRSLETRLKQDGIDSRLLHTSHAFHSSMMEPIMEEFKNVIAKTELKEPELPYLSNVTGNWMTSADATDPEYYARQIRQPVRFFDNLEQVLSTKGNLLLEVGPGKTLATFARQHPGCSLDTIILSSIRHPRDEVADYKYLLHNIGRFWLAGGEIDWEKVYDGEERMRLPLPTYPFDRQRYWLDMKPVAGSAPQDAASIIKKQDSKQWIYAPSWKSTPITLSEPLSVDPDDKKKWLVFTNQDSFSKTITGKLEKNNIPFIQVGHGSKRTSANGSYQINPAEAADFEHLLKDLSEREITFDRILFLWTHSAAESIDKNLLYGFQSLVHLARALSKTNINDKLRLVVVTANHFQVTGMDNVDYNHAVVSGLLKVIPQELVNLSVQHFDMGTGSEDTGTDVLLSEVQKEDIHPVVAIRNNLRWLLNFEQLTLNSSTESPASFSDKTFVLTGGLGRIGLEIAEWLAAGGAKHIILLDVVDFPEKQKWEAIKKTHDHEDPVHIKIERLQKLEESGTQISIHSVDLKNQDKISGLFEGIGQVEGIFHLAGKVGETSFKTLAELSEEDWEGQFDAKVYGLLSFAKVVKRFKPSFCVLQSSLSAILGGLGFGAYAAANHFMDTFAAAQTAQKNETPSKTRWLSVNWEGWNFGELPGADAMGSETANLALSPAEGIETLSQVLELTHLDQMIISTADLNLRLEKWVTKLKPEKDPATAETKGSKYSRPNLATPLVEPETDLQKEIAGIWQQLLSIEPIGLHDNFFDLGGNSLMGTQLIAKMREHFRVDLPLRSLFEDPTIAGVSSMIEKTSGEESEEISKVSSMLEQLENLSDEEAAKLLNNKKKNS